MKRRAPSDAVEDDGEMLDAIRAWRQRQDDRRSWLVDNDFLAGTALEEARSRLESRS